MMAEEAYKACPHNPPHLFTSCAIYMITGGTLSSRLLLDSDAKKAHFCETLFQRAAILEWNIEAWAVLGNHYHFVAQAPEEAATLKLLIQAVHSLTARYINQQDGIRGRRVWYNYWDTCITYESSYIARLHYVHTNPVKHGLAGRAADYPFCSCRWFEERADPAWRRMVFSQPVDRVRVVDNF
jgi:putative transposase